MSLWDTDYNYTNARLEDIYEAGEKRGESIANNVAIEDMPKIGRDNIETEDGVKDCFMDNCAQAEENNRQFSPFEFVAKEINDREDADDAWYFFDEGISNGFERVWDECVTEVTEEYAEELTKDMLDERYGDFEIAGHTFHAGEILEKVDPIAFDQQVNDYMDPWEIVKE